MNTTKSFLFAVLILLAAIPFITSQRSHANKSLPNIKVIEAENMTLTAAKIQEAKGASGGKAVKLLSKEANTSIQLSLPEGQYVANVILKANSVEADGFFLVADNKAKRTSSGHHHNKWVYGNNFIIFRSDGKKPVNLKVSSSIKDQQTAEYGMLVDRIELIEFSKSAEILDHWTGLNFKL